MNNVHMKVSNSKLFRNPDVLVGFRDYWKHYLFIQGTSRFPNYVMDVSFAEKERKIIPWLKKEINYLINIEKEINYSNWISHPVISWSLTATLTIILDAAIAELKRGIHGFKIDERTEELIIQNADIKRFCNVLSENESLADYVFDMIDSFCKINPFVFSYDFMPHRCQYCGTLVVQGRVRCVACGAPY